MRQMCPYLMGTPGVERDPHELQAVPAGKHLVFGDDAFPCAVGCGIAHRDLIGRGEVTMQRYCLKTLRSRMASFMQRRAAAFLAAMTSPSVFRSMRLQSAGAKVCSAAGSYSPLLWRYFWISSSSETAPFSPPCAYMPEGLYTMRMFSSS